MRARTTLTLDPEIARELEAVRQERKESFRAVANEALRRGIQEMRAPRKRKIGTIRPVSGTGPRLNNYDGTSEILDSIEGDYHK